MKGYHFFRLNKSILSHPKDFYSLTEQNRKPAVPGGEAVPEVAQADSPDKTRQHETSEAGMKEVLTVTSPVRTRIEGTRT